MLKIEEKSARTQPVKKKGLSKRVVAFALIGAVVLGIAGASAARSLLVPRFVAGTVLQGDGPAPPLSDLRTSAGEALNLAEWEGDVTLVYFGYLNCPDVCPTMLDTVSRARASLSAADRERVRLIMVSVDPARDSVDRLQAYVGNFDPTFLGAGGSREAIDRVATSYGVYYQVHDPEGADLNRYTVDHTASLMGVGPDGALRVVWGPTVDEENLATDLEYLLS